MAKFINVEGEEKEVKPKNGNDFTLGELREGVIYTDEKGIRHRNIEIINLPSGNRMVVNEEGKLLGLSENKKAIEIWKKEFPIEEFPNNNDQLVVGNIVIATPREVGEFLYQDQFVKGLKEGSELVDSDKQKRYVLYLPKNLDSEIQLTGYDDHCVCESWYSPEEIYKNFEATGEVKDIKKLSEVETRCDCPKEEDDFSGAEEGDR